jgi:hypothetical protein
LGHVQPEWRSEFRIYGLLIRVETELPKSEHVAELSYRRKHELRELLS